MAEKESPAMPIAATDVRLETGRSKTRYCMVYLVVNNAKKKILIE
jgi:hypothetical protein